MSGSEELYFLIKSFCCFDSFTEDKFYLSEISSIDVSFLPSPTGSSPYRPLLII